MVVSNFTMTAFLKTAVKAALIFAIGMWAFAVYPQSANAYDVSKFCKTGEKSAVIAIDVTSKYDTHDKDVFVQGLDSILSSLGGGQRFEILTIEQEFSASRADL